MFLIDKIVTFGNNPTPRPHIRRKDMADMLSPKAYAELLRLLGQIGISPEVLREALASPESHPIMDPFKVHPSFNLKHGVYRDLGYVMEQANKRVRAAGYDPQNFTWLSPKDPPPTSENASVVTVLFDTLDNLEETACLHWGSVGDEHADTKMEGIDSFDRRHLNRVHDPKFDLFRRRTRYWIQVDLETHLGADVQWVRAQTDSQSLAGLEVLCAIGQHPYVGLRTSYRLMMNLPGLQITTADGSQRALCVRCDPIEDRVTLFTCDPNEARSNWFNPILV